MADDQKTEIVDAEIELKSLDATIDIETVFESAWENAKEQSYEIAVIDLGWYTDNKTDWSSKQFSRFDKTKAGFRLAEEVRKNNPDAMIIIYSAHVDEYLDAISSNRYFYLKKQYNDQSRSMLRGMVQVLLQRLPIEKRLKQELEKAKKDAGHLPSSSKYIFMASLMGFIVPVVGAAAIYWVSKNIYYSITTLILSMTLVLIALVASRNITLKEAAAFMDKMYTLGISSETPNQANPADTKKRRG